MIMIIIMMIIMMMIFIVICAHVENSTLHGRNVADHIRLPSGATDLLHQAKSLLTRLGCPARADGRVVADRIWLRAAALMAAL